MACRGSRRGIPCFAARAGRGEKPADRPSTEKPAAKTGPEKSDKAGYTKATDPKKRQKGAAKTTTHPKKAQPNGGGTVVVEEFPNVGDKDPCAVNPNPPACQA